MSCPDRAEKKTLGSHWDPLRVCAVVLLAQLCLTLFNPMDTAHQPTLSMGFSRQEYWSGLPCPPPGEPTDLRIKPGSLAFQADSSPTEPQRKALKVYTCVHDIPRLPLRISAWSSPESHWAEERARVKPEAGVCPAQSLISSSLKQVDGPGVSLSSSLEQLSEPVEKLPAHPKPQHPWIPCGLKSKDLSEFMEIRRITG